MFLHERLKKQGLNMNFQSDYKMSFASVTQRIVIKNWIQLLPRKKTKGILFNIGQYLN